MYNELQGCTLYSDVQWRTVKYHDIQWCTSLMLSDVHWHTVIHRATPDAAQRNPCWTLEIKPWNKWHMIYLGQHSAKAASCWPCHWKIMKILSVGREGRETGTGKSFCRQRCWYWFLKVSIVRMGVLQLLTPDNFYGLTINTVNITVSIVRP